MSKLDVPRSAAWSRRRVLRALAPVPLLAAGGCAGSDNGSSAAADGAAGPGPSPGAPSAAGSAGPAPHPPGAPAPAEFSEAPEAANLVALTFHGDGPPNLAYALLNEAEQSGARLTVLAVGQWLANYPYMAERVLSGGHELGNHTEHHYAIDRIPEDMAYREIETCAARLEKLTGSRGRWFRQSQGQHATPEVRAAANRCGYRTLLSYDLDPQDFRDPGSDTIVRNVLGTIQGGDVVSMHLGHPETVVALPLILEGLAQRGLRPVTASELFPDYGGPSPRPRPRSLPSRPFQPPQKQ